MSRGAGPWERSGKGDDLPKGPRLGLLHECQWLSSAPELELTDTLFRAAPRPAPPPRGRTVGRSRGGRGVRLGRLGKMLRDRCGSHDGQ